MARMDSAWRPGASAPLGKSKRPPRSLTTVSVMAEPAARALTSTPSIGPSSVEVTRPLRPCAAAGPQNARSRPQRAAGVNPGFTASAALEPALGLDGLDRLGFRRGPPDDARLLVSILGAGDDDVARIDLLAEAGELVQPCGGSARNERYAVLDVRRDLRVGHRHAAPVLDEAEERRTFVVMIVEIAQHLAPGERRGRSREQREVDEKGSGAEELHRSSHRRK